MAVGAVKYARKKGLSVPEDVNIIGFNNSELAVCCEPELSSIDSRSEVLCKTAVDSMMMALSGHPVRHKKIMKGLKRILAAALCVSMGAVTMFGMSGCSSVTGGKRIIRISHAQSETHPEHIGLLKFKEYVEENLGDKYEVQIFPNEILGAAQRAIELTQTGAIDFVVAGNFCRCVRDFQYALAVYIRGCLP